jgi:hypothetical protein
MTDQYKRARTVKLASQLGCKGPLALRGVEERRKMTTERC